MKIIYLTRFFTIMILLVFPLLVSAAKISIKDGPQLDVWGYAQLVAESVDTDDDGDDLNFTADRVRFGTKMKWGQWSGALQFDANKTGDDNEGTLDSFIRDAFAGYKFSDAFAVKVGQYKTPVGMAFNMSGRKLPLMRRTMSTRLVLDRTIGAMVSGRYIGGSKEAGGFGYDIGVFNPAGRSKAYEDTEHNTRGDDLSYAYRVMYDYGKVLHIEASYGEIENAGSTETSTTSEDYEVFDIGATYTKGPMRIRAEYIDGKDVQGWDGYDEESWFVEGGYKFTDMVEGVVRYQESECDNCGGTAGKDQELRRTEIGLNLFFGQNATNGRLQLYVADVGDDEEKYSGITGGGDNNFDMVGAQVQFAF